MKRIFLIRHGQTQGNTEGRWLGYNSSDSLNDYGIKQARNTADTLKELNFDTRKIYASRTARALEHAEIIQKQLDIEIEKISSISEINLGVLEDRSRAEGKKLLPEEVAYWENNLVKFHPPLGESALQASERFYETIKLLTQNSPYNDLIFITHGVVIKLFLARILKESIATGETKIEVPFTTHGSITLINFEENYFKFKKIIENKFPDSKEIANFG